MDIHRCRFVPFPLSSINAVAFSHSTPVPPSTRTPKTLRLAVGRANGDIEIWNPLNGRWVQECILSGGKDRSIEGLAWTHDPESEDSTGKKIAGNLRLFSIGYSSVITEWDLALGKPAAYSDGNYGDIWCMEAQPRWVRSSASHDEADGDKYQCLAAGCADGTLVLFSTADGELKFLRTLQRPSSRKARVLCLAFQGRQRIVAGYSDSTLRIFETNGRGRLISTLSLGAGQNNGAKASEIFTWAVKCLSDGTIISGDSTGEIKIWDPATSTLMQRIKAHTSDVLTIAPSADGMSMMSGGMDKRTVVYKRTGTGKQKTRWAEISHQRLHSSDIKAMASFEGGDMRVIASGGLDSTLVIIPMDRVGQEYTRSLPSLPNSPPIRSSPKERLIMSWWNRDIFIWQVEPLKNVGADGKDRASGEPLSRKLVAQIKLQGEEHITAVSLAPNGSLVAVSTISETKVFILSPRSSGKGLKVQKMEIPASLAGCGAKLLDFSPDSKWLAAVRADSSVYAYRLQEKERTHRHGYEFVNNVKLSRKIRTTQAKTLEGSLRNYPNSVSRIAWSSDSRIFVACDLTGYFDAWMLEGHEDLLHDDSDALPEHRMEIAPDGSSDDSEDEGTQDQGIIFGQHWTRIQAALPKLPSAPLVLSFRPGQIPANTLVRNGNIDSHPTRHNPHPQAYNPPDGEDRLFVVTAQNHFFEYNVMNGQLSEWSRRNPPELLPQEFKDIRECVMGCVWDFSGSGVAERNRIWLYGSTWLWMFDLSQDLQTEHHDPGETSASEEVSGAGAIVTSKKRKRETMIEEYRAAERESSRKNTSGAGGRVRANERNGGIGSGMFRYGKDGQRTWVNFELAQVALGAANGSLPDSQGAEHDDKNGYESFEDDAPAADGNGRSGGPSLQKLVRLRRNELQLNGYAAAAGSERNGDVGIAIDLDKEIDSVQAMPGPSYWRTYKYRPLLGMVSLGDHSGDGEPGIEVALVERPLWDSNPLP